MSRPLTPTAILEQKGAFDHDPGRRAAREGEPQGRGPLGDPPEYFTPMQKSAWRELELLAPEGVLTGSDRVAVEMYSQLVARLRGERYDDHGNADDGNGYPRPLKAAEVTQLLNLLGRFGMTPSDRVRLKVPDKPKKPANRFAAMASEATDVQ